MKDIVMIHEGLDPNVERTEEEKEGSVQRMAGQILCNTNKQTAKLL